MRLSCAQYRCTSPASGGSSSSAPSLSMHTPARCVGHGDAAGHRRAGGGGLAWGDRVKRQDQCLKRSARVMQKLMMNRGLTRVVEKVLEKMIRRVMKCRVRWLRLNAISAAPETCLLATAAVTLCLPAGCDRAGCRGIQRVHHHATGGPAGAWAMPAACTPRRCWVQGFLGACKGAGAAACCCRPCAFICGLRVCTVPSSQYRAVLGQHPRVENDMLCCLQDCC